MPASAPPPPPTPSRRHTEGCWTPPTRCLPQDTPREGQRPRTVRSQTAALPAASRSQRGRRPPWRRCSARGRRPGGRKGAGRGRVDQGTHRRSCPHLGAGRGQAEAEATRRTSVAGIHQGGRGRSSVPTCCGAPPPPPLRPQSGQTAAAKLLESHARTQLPAGSSSPRSIPAFSASCPTPADTQATHPATLPDALEAPPCPGHLLECDPLFLHPGQGRAAVEHLLVEPAPGALPGAPGVDGQRVEHHG